MPTYSCQQCGQPFDAIPPDDVHVVAMADKCPVCEVNRTQAYITTQFECSNCNGKNALNWHENGVHTEIEAKYARMQLARRDSIWKGQ